MDNWQLLVILGLGFVSLVLIVFFLPKAQEREHRAKYHCHCSYSGMMIYIDENCPKYGEKP